MAEETCVPRESQQPETYTVTTECFTAAPVTASMNLMLTGDSGQGNRRNMRSMVADTLGKRSDCSFENIIVLCIDACVLLVQARHTCCVMWLGA